MTKKITEENGVVPTYANRVKRGITKGAAFGGVGAAVGLGHAMYKNAQDHGQRSVAAKKGWKSRKSHQESELENEVLGAISEVSGVDEGIWDNIKKGAVRGARQGAYQGAFASDSAAMSFGPTTGALVHGAHVVAGGLSGAVSGALMKDDDEEVDDDTVVEGVGYVEDFLAETTGSYSVGADPIPGFSPLDNNKVSIKDMGDGKFSIVVLEDGAEIEVDTGLSGDEAKELATEYALMFTSGPYTESSDVKTHKENKMISTKKLFEAVARGADPKAAVAQFLKSKLSEDTDVATMVPATDTQGGELLGVDVEDPEDDAVMSAEIGPGSPIVPMADKSPVDAAVPSTELGTKDGEAAVDAAVAAADTAEKEDEFMESRRLRERVRQSLARIVEEEGGMPPEVQAKIDAAKEGGEEGGEEEKEGGEEEKEGGEESAEKKEARARRIRARIREARRLRRMREEEEAGSEEGEEEIDGEEDDMEESNSFRKAQRNESDTITRQRNRRSVTPARFESVANTFTRTVREQEEGTPEPPGSEMLPDESDEEVIVAPLEGRRPKSMRARLEARRARLRRMREEEGDEDKEAVNFPPSEYKQEEPAEPGDETGDEGGEYKGEGLVGDITGGEVDDDDTELRKPESISSRRRARFLEARRRARARRLREHINPMMQPGQKVRERSSGKAGRIVDNEVYSKGQHQYMVAFFEEARTRRVRHEDLERV